MKRLIALALSYAATASPSFAASPQWWTSPQTAIMENGAEANDFGPANLGQLKFVARQARRHLDLVIPSGAGSAISSMVDAFQSSDDDYAPINLGQLKAIAKPFYDRLRNSPINFDTKLSLQSHSDASWPYVYPWDSNFPKAENYAPANLGQLKWVFSFDLTNRDSDGHGLSDTWELLHFGSIGHYATADDDGDGISNANESSNGTVPNKKDNPLLKLKVSVTLK